MSVMVVMVRKSQSFMFCEAGSIMLCVWGTPRPQRTQSFRRKENSSLDFIATE